MIVRIDPASPATAAEQLVTQIAAAIGSGEVHPGARLPTIRALAADLALAPGTVARAYAELERDGWVHTQGRRGTVVAERSTNRADDELAAAARRLAEVARRHGDAANGAAAAHRALDLAWAQIERSGRRD